MKSSTHGGAEHSISKCFKPRFWVYASSFDVVRCDVFDAPLFRLPVVEESELTPQHEPC